MLQTRQNIFPDRRDYTPDSYPKIYWSYHLNLSDSGKEQYNDFEWHKCNCKVHQKGTKISNYINNAA